MKRYGSESSILDEVIEKAKEAAQQQEQPGEQPEVPKFSEVKNNLKNLREAQQEQKLPGRPTGIRTPVLDYSMGKNTPVPTTDVTQPWEKYRRPDYSIRKPAVDTTIGSPQRVWPVVNKPLDLDARKGDTQKQLDALKAQRAALAEQAKAEQEAQRQKEKAESEKRRDNDPLNSLNAGTANQPKQSGANRNMAAAQPYNMGVGAYQKEETYVPGGDKQPDNTGAYPRHSYQGATAAATELSDTDKQIKELDRQIREKEAHMQMLERTERQQKRGKRRAELEQVAEKEDFEKKSRYQSTAVEGTLEKLTSQYSMGYEDLTYEYINDTPGVRDAVKLRSVVTQGATDLNPMMDLYKGITGDTHNIAAMGYEYMKPKEVKIYNYLYRRKGKETAEEYLDLLQEELNERKGGKIADDLEEKLLLQYGYGFYAGVDQFGQGVKNAFNFTDDYIPVSSTQFASRDIREDLYNTGSDIMDGTSWGQVGYDLFNTTGNMLPSIALNFAAPGVGTAAMGVSAAGNAYQDMLNQGYSKEQARAYSTMVGISEVGLEKLLNGVPQMGKSVMSEKVLRNLAKLDNVFGRVAKSKVGQMFFSGFSEAVEEPTQNVVDNLLWSAVTGEEIDIQGEELIYDGLLAFMTGGSFKGVDILTNSGEKAGGGAEGVKVPEGVKAPEGAVTAEPEGVAADAAKSENPVGELMEGFDIPKSEAPVKTEEQQNLDAAMKEILGVENGGIDTETTVDYNNIIKNEGENYGQRIDDRTAGVGDSAQGMAGVQPGDRPSVERGQEHGGVAGNSGVLRLSTELQNAREKRGLPSFDLYDTSATPQEYERALVAGRNSDAVNGWCVTPKSAQELAEGNVRTAMNADHTVGVGVAPDGDIVAVFKNRNGGPRKALDTAMPVAIEMGGDRLDCYGEGLVRVYEGYGFIPVARVEFNPEYANDGWTPDKGQPYIYVMMHNGDSAATVTEKMHSYKLSTQAELDALPTYGKDAYDEAMRYRDQMMQGRKKNADDSGMTGAAKGRDESVGAATRGFSGKEGYNDLLTDENSQPDRPGDVRPMEVLKTDPYGRRVSETAANLYGAEVTPDNMADAIQELIYEGALGFDTRTNQESLEAAAKAIQEKGMAATEKAINKAVMAGKVQDGDIEKAMILYAAYANKNSQQAQERAAELMVDLATMANMTGRNLQLFKLLRRMTPEGQLMTVQKNIGRYVENLNEGRSRRKQVEPQVSTELEKCFMEAAENAATPENAASAALAVTIDNTLAEAVEAAAENAWTAFGQSDNAPATNDFAENTGRRVADRLTAEAKESNTTVEDILFRDIMRFANDKAQQSKTEERQSKNDNLQALGDYYRYRPFFQSAWDSARARVEQAMRDMPEGDPRIEKLEQFLARGDGYIETPNRTPVMDSDYSNPQSTVRKGTKEAANAAGIRMDNRTERIREVKTELRDVLIENAHNKEAAARKIARLAVEKLGLDGVAAKEMSRSMVRAFYHDLAEQSARRVAQMFTKSETRKTIQKTLAQRLEELYNMGAFSMPEYRQAAFDSLFGEGSGIDIPDSLMKKFTDSAEELKEQAMQDIYAAVASQIKPTLGEVWDAWRNLSMLGNVKTHERNFFATGAFRPYVALKRTIGAGIETLALERENRTKAVLGVSKNSRELFKWAKEDARTKATKKAMDYTGTTGDEARSAIDDYRKILPGFLDTARKKNMEAMEAEDMFFKRREYALSLASFLKARGYTAEQVKSGTVPENVMQEGRELAVKEAMKATFNDQNRFSNAMSKLRFKGNSVWARTANVVSKGTVPYLKTPANVLVRVKEYSPLELGTTLLTMKGKIQRGEATMAECIDKIASGLTGTGVMLLGAALSAGMIPGVRLIGKIEDDDEYPEDAKEYSIQIGDEYYSISWLSPANIPLFIGSNLYNEFSKKSEDGDLDGWDIVSALAETGSDALDPMLELSMLSSLNDVFNNVAYEDSLGDKGLAFLSTAVTSYFMQGLPTIAGQLEQSTEETQRVVFSNADNPIQRAFEKTVGKATQKVPGIDLYQIDKIDENGEPVQNSENWVIRAANALFNPFNVTKTKSGNVIEERRRLSQILDYEIKPPDVPKTVTFTDSDGVKHENYRLTGEEYTEFQKVQGQTQNRILGEIVESDNYEALTDEQKAKVFGYVYDYARESGRMEAIEGYPGFKDSWMEGIGGNEADAIVQKVVKGTFDDAFSGMTECWRNGKDDSASVEALEEAYQVYKGLDRKTRKKLVEDSGGRLEAYFTARENGIDTETFVKYYEKYYEIDNADLKESEKAAKWSYELQRAVERGKLDEDEEKTLRESLKFYNMFPADTAKFDQLTDAGIDSEDAWEIGELLDGLEPEKGRTNVRDVQKYEEIADYDGLTSNEMDIVMKMYMPDYDPKDVKPDKTELKYDTVRGMGFTPAEYAKMLRIYQDEEDEGGRGTKQRTISHIQKEMGVSRGVATKLYEIYYGSYFKKK